MSRAPPPPKQRDSTAARPHPQTAQKSGFWRIETTVKSERILSSDGVSAKWKGTAYCCLATGSKSTLGPPGCDPVREPFVLLARNPPNQGMSLLRPPAGLTVARITSTALSLFSPVEKSPFSTTQLTGSVLRRFRLLLFRAPLPRAPLRRSAPPEIRMAPICSRNSLSLPWLMMPTLSRLRRGYCAKICDRKKSGLLPVEAKQRRVVNTILAVLLRLTATTETSLSMSGGLAALPRSARGLAGVWPAFPASERR